MTIRVSSPYFSVSASMLTAGVTVPARRRIHLRYSSGNALPRAWLAAAPTQ